MASDVKEIVKSINYDLLPPKSWEEPLFAALRVVPTLKQACLAAGVSRQAVHQWARKCSRFALAFAEAREDGIDSIEEPLMRKAIKGDTNASIFLLKHLRPSVYSESRAGGKDNSPVSFTLNIGGPIGELEKDSTPAMKVIEAPKGGDG